MGHYNTKGLDTYGHKHAIQKVQVCDGLYTEYASWKHSPVSTHTSIETPQIHSTTTRSTCY